MKPIFLLFLLLALPLHVRAGGGDDDNYTTQRLLVFNDRGEVLLQSNAMGWSTPGQRFDTRLSLRASLDSLAGKYGIRIENVALAGMLTYEYGFTTALSTRTHYMARIAGGEPKAPDGTRELRWFSRDEAIAAISADSQKSPPSFVQMTTRMLREPGTIWGGAFHVWQEGDAYRSRVVEPMYPLGATLWTPAGAVSGDPR
ncbi:hypothetical protein [Pseudoxanthomonas putridarboris]|uniref:Nudix hydrolase domain-containing protein n=1 Tax=Pseudoxanthomonas putridarboris TaxID=752605 RepID=A0ABU9IYW3_9GAMM